MKYDKKKLEEILKRFEDVMKENIAFEKVSFHYSHSRYQFI